jgi:hypothetical protein
MNRLFATFLLILLTWIAIELHRIQAVIKVDDFIVRKIDIHLGTRLEESSEVS